MIFKFINIQQIQDKPNQIDFNPKLAIEQLDNWLDGFVSLLPNMVAALLVGLIFYGLAKLMYYLVIKALKVQNRENLGRVAGGFVKWIILILGFLMAATIVVPTLRVGDVIAGLGVSSVAIGFAFKDILQNWLAGLLILLRQPFEIGDQIVVGDYEGTVERIETRATIIKQYNNQRVVVPNSDIYTNSIKVKTANQYTRSQYDVGIGYGDSIDDAADAIQKIVKEVEGVQKDKPVEALPWDLAASWVTIRVRWWTDSQRPEVVKTYAKVIQAIKEALDGAQIDMPYDTKVHLFHDQTEDTDGDRTAQREGWPTVKNGENPKPKNK